jgi:magnesium-transporting ATPase (P-type)
LKLDAITQIVIEQKPTEEYAALQRRKERFERLGIFSLSLFAFLAVALVLGWTTYYKLHWFGFNLIFGAAFVAMFLFGLLSVFFFNYPKVFMKMDKVNPRLEDPFVAAVCGCRPAAGNYR